MEFIQSDKDNISYTGFSIRRYDITSHFSIISRITNLSIYPQDFKIINEQNVIDSYNIIIPIYKCCNKSAKYINSFKHTIYKVIDIIYNWGIESRHNIYKKLQIKHPDIKENHFNEAFKYTLYIKRSEYAKYYIQIGEKELNSWFMLYIPTDDIIKKM